jgi:hypothetical protein
MVNKKLGVGMWAAALIFVLLMGGCTTRIGDFTIMSSKNIDLSRVGEFYRSATTVQGSDSVITVLFFFPVSSKTTDLKTAMDNALSKIPGSQAIVDVRFSRRKLNFVLFQIETFIVSGNVLFDPTLAGAPETSPDKPYLVMETKDGKYFTKRYVDENEYGHLLAQK